MKTTATISTAFAATLLLLVISFLLLQGEGFAQAPASPAPAAPQEPKSPLIVHKCEDFTPTGKGDNAEWAKAGWTPLQKLDEGGETDATRFKILYSSTGVYILFEGADTRITTKFDKDFDDLYQGDVFEVFMQPDPATPVYVEYEVNALDKELVLLIPNMNGSTAGWIPWHYEGRKKVVKKVAVTGGSSAQDQKISSWSAELFFPFSLFRPFSNVPAKSGSVWNANFYRLDYDSGKMIKWAWSPVLKSFHEFKQFRQIQFE